MVKSPLASMKEKFGSKEKLVEKLAGMVEPLEGETRDDLKTRLRGASNHKLLRLLAAEEKVQEIFGSKDKLVAEIVKLERPGSKKPDEDYRSALERKSKAELIALHAGATRRAKARARRAAPGRPRAKRKAS
jgi:hypothetical protein